MARAETIESVGETGIGINGLFSQHSTCCMELTGPLHTWPGLLSTTAIIISSGTGTSPMDLHHITSFLHAEGQDQPQFHHQVPTLSSLPLPHHNQQEEFDEGFPGEQSGRKRSMHVCSSRWNSLKINPLTFLNKNIFFAFNYLFPWGMNNN